MEVEWSVSKTKQLIELYKSKPLLWNPTHECYKVTRVRQEALVDISESLEVGKHEVERKLKNLAGQFAREIKRSKLKSGGQTYQSKWFAFKLLHFLSERNRNCESKGNQDVARIESDSEDQEPLAETETQTTSSTNEKQLKDLKILKTGKKTGPEKKANRETTNNTDLDSESETDELIEANDIPSTSGVKPKEKPATVFAVPKSVGRKRTSVSEPVEEAYKITKTVYEGKRMKDDCDLFAEHIAFCLRQLPSDQIRYNVQHALSTLLWEAQSGKYNNYHAAISYPLPEVQYSNNNTTEDIF